MVFVSFAQNLEDVALHRALGHIGAGFYVDVGAHDPVADSVTKAFYDRGWNGINIEPVPMWHERLAAERTRDANLQLAAASRDGTLELFEIPGSGLSTTDAAIAARHADEGYAVRSHEVSCRRLDGICAERGVTEIHFLKIDVEGAELDVLEGAGLDRLRPWIVVVEATQPKTQIATHEQWEHVLTGNGYCFVRFDGINRFYVAEEHRELAGALAAGPGDDYVRYSRSGAKLLGRRLRYTLSKLGRRRGRGPA